MLPKTYNPKEFEERIYSEHEQKGYFKPEINSGGEPYTVLFPPPNANASLHAGHAQRSAVQDTYTRINRMEGRAALLIPGADHAGIQTATVFDKKLWKEEGKTRFDLGFEEYHKQIYAFVKQMRFGIYDQFRKIGLSADFDREYFTIEPRLTKTVRRNFKRLWRDGLVYKGKYLVNWSYKAGTVLSDAETEEMEEQTKLVYIRYPLIPKNSTVWELNFRIDSIFDAIKDGRKTVETRALNPEELHRFFLDIKKGDFIVCKNKNTGEKLLVRVKGSRSYSNLDELAYKEAPIKILPDDFKSQGGDLILKQNVQPYFKEKMEAYLGKKYIDKINENGAVAIDIELCFLSNFSNSELLTAQIEVFDEESLRGLKSKTNSIAFISDRINQEEMEQLEPGEIVSFLNPDTGESVMKRIRGVKFYRSADEFYSSPESEESKTIYESGNILSFFENPEREPELSAVLFYTDEVTGEPVNYITVATTRPETMLGDTAVAVNSNDERYLPLKGYRCLIPVAYRDVPIIFDERIEKEFGTGAVKITPAHDKLDYEIGRDHNLEMMEVIGKDNQMLGNTGTYDGKSTEECRTELVGHLSRAGYIEQIDDYVHTVKICERTKCKIENLLSDEWFLRVKPAMTESTIEKIENGEIKILPERYKSQLINFLENHYDWPLSRQIWWGHTIPVFYSDPEKKSFEVSVTGYPECDFCFVRHGESEHNLQKILAGSGSSFDKLTREGEKQAKELAEFLRKQKFDAILSGTAHRCRQTAEILAESLNLQNSIISDERLNERDYGELEGMDKDTFKNLPQEEIDLKTEPQDQVLGRADEFIKETAHKFVGKRVLVVTHSSVLYSVVARFEEKTVEQLKKEGFSTHNCSTYFYEEPVGQFYKDQGFTEETDTFDTWFSSGQLTYTALDGPNHMPDFQNFYPTDLHETAYEIRYLWTCRMLMFGNYFTGKLPYSKAIYSGWIMNEKGRKMSKSVGNVINPLDYIDQYGADATRLSLLSEVGLGENARIGTKKVELLRNFLTKLWNSTRFLQIQFMDAREGFETERIDLETISSIKLSEIKHPVNRFLIIQLQKLQSELQKLYEIDQISLLLGSVREFIYSVFCDFYIEATKKLSGDAYDEAKSVSLFTLHRVLCFLQPFAPFVTEKIFRSVFASDKPLLLHRFFEPLLAGTDTSHYLADESRTENLIQVIYESRSMQNELLQDSSFGQISVHKKTDFDQLDDILNHFLRNISVVEGEGGIFVNDNFSISIETDSSKKEQFRAMINGKIAETEGYIARIKGKLSNANFVEKADPEVVEQERIKLSVSEKRLSTLSALRN